MSNDEKVKVSTIFTECRYCGRETFQMEVSLMANLYRTCTTCGEHYFVPKPKGETNE